MTLETISKIGKTLDFLYEELSWTSLFYYSNQALYKAILVQREQKGQSLFRNSFFAAAYEATLSESVLGLSKLLIHHKDSVSLEYLLNLIEQSTDEIPFADADEVQSSLIFHRVKLKKYQSLFRQVKSQRDKRVAHSDRNIINQPEIMLNEQPIIIDELESCLDDILSILNTYLMYTKQIEYDLSHLEARTQQDVDDLVSMYVS